MSVVESEFIGGVLTVTLADEANRNALSAELVSDLVAVLDEADTDPNVRVVVLTNAGSVFCAGANLRERSGRSEPTADRGIDPGDLFSRFRASPKPYVGRIAGHCVAGGMGLAAAMDVSIAIDTAKFGFPEVRIGVAPALISVLCLPKMRPAEAASAMLRGNRFLASEAQRMGIINSAVTADQLDDEVDSVVGDLMAGGPEAIAHTKKLLSQVPDMDYDEAIAWAKGLSAELFKTDEAKEGMTAYLEKRAASWVPPEAQSRKTKRRRAGRD